MPPQGQDLVRATQATFDAAADCLARCKVTLVREEQPPPNLLLPGQLEDLLKTKAWRARFLEALSSLPAAFTSYGVIQPGEFSGLVMRGSLAAIITQGNRALYIYLFVGLPEGIPSRRPAGSIYIIADPKDGKLAGSWNGANKFDQYRFLGAPDKLAPLLAFQVAREAEMGKSWMTDQLFRPAPVVLPLPPDRVAYTRERLDYLAGLLDGGEINGVRSAFYKGDQIRAAADANRTHWYAIELNGKLCIDGTSPARQIEDIRNTGWQARTRDTTDASGRLVKVEIEHDEGRTIVTRTAYTSMAACEADTARRNAIPDRYR